MPSPSDELVAAVGAGDVDAVRRALDAGAHANHAPEIDDPRDSGREPVLFTACKKRFTAIVILLLERGADPNSFRTAVSPREYWDDAGRDARTSSQSCLSVAVPDLKIMKALLESGAADAYLRGPTPETEALLAAYRSRR